MIELSFSKCIVSSLPDCGEWRDSSDENEEGICMPRKMGPWPGETSREVILDGSRLRGGTFRERSSSPCSSVGDTAADEPESSASDTSSEAAKLLEMSGSEETKAYED